MASMVRSSVIHWKKKLERYSTDENITLNVIHKLSKVHITVELLQETGIGKVIRTLAKKPGTVGENALAVLTKWRQIVAGNTKTQENNPKSVNSKHGSYKKESAEENKSTEVSEKRTKPLSQKHINIKKSSSESEHKQKSTISKNSKEISPERKIKKHSNGINGNYSDSCPVPYKYEKDELPSKCIDYDPNSEVNLYYTPEHPELYPDRKKIKKKIKNDTEKLFDSGHSNSEVKGEKRKIPDSESSKCRESEPKAKKIKHEASLAFSTSHLSQSKHEPEKKEKVDLQKKNEGKEKSHNHTNHFSSQKGSSHKNSRPADLLLKVSSGKKHVETGQPEDRMSPQSKIHSKDKVSKEKLKIQSTEAFTSSEVSFEDCLGFNDIVSVKRKKSSIKSSSSSSKKPKTATTSSKGSSLSSSSSSSSSNLGNTYNPDAEKKSCLKLVPAAPLNPIHLNEVDILSTLPQPQPNYRPLPPRSTDGSNAKKKVLSNEDAIRFTSSRREKTAVYSGRRSAYFLGKQAVPSLFDICTRILIDNIDAIEYMGEVPYFLVKPILERCNPMQLYTIEHYNPSLLEETHDLWEVHCRRVYRTEEPQENETWRDLYWRCCEEREIRLKNVTANISKSMSKSNPVRQVKLAYVDSVAKPPRDVARRQAKNGTGLPVNHKMKPGPSSKATPRPSAPTVNFAVASTSKAQTSFVPKKPKIAPLMAKTLKSMKQCFRRK